MSEIDRAGGDDAVVAFRYANGELDKVAAAAFESRLADDQAARDALCAAVCLRQSMTSDTELTPDPAYREGVRVRLQASRRRVAGRIGFRGTPTTWALGGAAAAALLLVTLRLVSQGADLENAVPAVAIQMPGPAAECVEAEDDGDDIPELIGGQHLARAVHEENRRKVRAEDRRIVRLEDRAARRAPTTYKQ
jgi:anti-sigma-K factor RskA